MEKLKERIKFLRQKFNIPNQQSLADILGVSLDRVKSIESGRVKKLHPEEVDVLVKKFHLSPHWLLTGEGEMYEKSSSSADRDSIEVEILSVRPSAGAGSNLEAVDLFDSGEKLYIDKMLFKKPPKGKIRAMQVDGYSMVPMLFPDSWVLVDETKEFTGDGLYVINFDNILMVKLLEMNLDTGNLWVKSVNPDYDSWEIKSSDQRHFEIFGKVVRCII